MANPRGMWISSLNLIPISIYYSVRKCLDQTWINDRDQFVVPNSNWNQDFEFHNNCLCYTIFNTNIQEKFGLNHWIPFTEQEVNAQNRFGSNFMTDFINGKIKNESEGNLFGNETSPSSSFGDFVGKKVILDSTTTYNGTVIDPNQIASTNYALSSYLPDASSGCTPPTTPGQCYGFEYELINGTTSKFDVYYNTDFNYCNCATDPNPTFSTEYTINGNTIAINSGTGFENWTFTGVSANNFNLHIISGGGSQVTERHYSVTP